MIPEPKRFTDHFLAGPDARGPFPAWTSGETCRLAGTDVPEFTEFMQRFARTNFNAGALRILPPERIIGWNAHDGWRSSWPQFRRLEVFGVDWQGRLFGFDRTRPSSAGPKISMIDTGGWGDLCEFDAAFRDFIDDELTNYHREILELGRFDDWLTRSGRTLHEHECIGYTLPLFLGGESNTTNMQQTDLEVYVELSGQLVQNTRNIAPGTKIRSFKISD